MSPHGVVCLDVTNGLISIEFAVPDNLQRGTAGINHDGPGFHRAARQHQNANGKHDELTALQ